MMSPSEFPKRKMKVLEEVDMGMWMTNQSTGVSKIVGVEGKSSSYWCY